MLSAKQSIITVALGLSLLPASATADVATPLPTMPPMPSAQRLMRVFQRFRPQMEDSRRRLMSAVRAALSPAQQDAIAAAIGANTVAEKPDSAALTTRIDSMLTPASRTAIAAAFQRYVTNQQALGQKMEAAMRSTQQSGSANTELLAPSPQPIVFTPSDAARLLASQPMGMAGSTLARPAHALTPQPGPFSSAVVMDSMLSPILRLRAETRMEMLASLSPAHRNAIGNLLGQFALGLDPGGVDVAAQMNALLSDAERRQILALQAQFAAESARQIEQMKAAAQQQLDAMGAQMSPAAFEWMKAMMQSRLEALHPPAPAPVDAGTALLAMLSLPVTGAFAR
jgi:hypothetical protein